MPYESSLNLPYQTLYILNPNNFPDQTDQVNYQEDKCRIIIDYFVFL